MNIAEIQLALDKHGLQLVDKLPNGEILVQRKTQLEQEAPCFCHDGVSLQMVSGGAAPEGYLGKVTLLIDGEYVAYVKVQPEQQAESVSMRLPKVGDKVICLEDESLGTVESLTAGGSPDINFDDGSRGTYLLREFAELFSYVTPPQQQAEPTPWRDMVVVTLVREGVNKHKARELADHFATPPQRPWVELEAEDLAQIESDEFWQTGNHMAIAMAVGAKLKERNT